MELANNISGKHGVYHTAQTEPYNNQPHDISYSPARALCMDIQAMTHYPMAQVAKLCDIPLSTFYRLAMGTTRNPLYKTFDKLLRTYFIVLLNNTQPSADLN